jgi:hypothetical protein
MFVSMVVCWNKVHLFHPQKVACNHYHYCFLNHVVLRHVYGAGEANVNVLLPM